MAEGKCTERSRVTWFKSVSDASFSCSCLIFLSFFRVVKSALLPVMVRRADVVFCDIPTLYICDDSYGFDSCNWPNSLIGKTSEIVCSLAMISDGGGLLVAGGLPVAYSQK